MTNISCVVEQNGVEFVMAGGPLVVPLMSVEIEGFLFLQFSITNWLPNY